MITVLVDTSVWINHFRILNPRLIDLLESDSVLLHPLVIAELACGTPPSRSNTLSDLSSLEKPHLPSLEEVMDFIERECLYGMGCGIVDMILLASTIITSGSRLWTLDKRLLTLSEKFGVIYSPNLH